MHGIGGVTDILQTGPDVREVTLFGNALMRVLLRKIRAG